MRIAVLALLLSSWALAVTPLELVQAGHYKRARAAAEAMLKVNPQDPVANNALARALFAFKQTDAALRHAEEAAAADPGQADYHAFLAQLYGRLAEQASVLRRLGLARKCKAAAEKALAIDPEHFEANVTLMVFLVKAPAVAGGDRKRGLAIAAQIARRQPGLGYLAQIQLAWEERRKEGLEELHRKAVEARPADYKARSIYAAYLLEQGKADLLETQGRELLRNDAARMPGYRYLAAALAMTDRVGAMEAVLRESEQKVPDDLTPFYTCARILAKKGKELPRAESYLKKYLAQAPEGEAPSHNDAKRELTAVLNLRGNA